MIYAEQVLFDCYNNSQEGETMNVSWAVIPQSMLNNFNPLTRDINGLTFYEHYIDGFVQTMMGLLGTRDITLYRNYIERIATLWNKIHVERNLPFKVVSCRLYSLGVRNVEELCCESLVKFDNDASKAFYEFNTILNAQLYNLNYDENELFTLAIIHEISSDRDAFAKYITTFFQTLTDYEITELNPIPMAFTSTIDEMMCERVMRTIMLYYKSNFFNTCADIVVHNVQLSVITAIELSIYIPDDILNRAYSANPLLPHIIISATLVPDHCVKLLQRIQNVNPSTQNADGRTAAMNFIVKYQALPLYKYIHDKNIRYNDGKTCHDLWKEKVDPQDIPDEIRIVKYNVLKCGCQHHGSYTYAIDNKLYCDACIESGVEKNGTMRKVYCSDKCPICYEEYDDEKAFGEYKECSHVICLECAKRTPQCPFCRN